MHLIWRVDHEGAADVGAVVLVSYTHAAHDGPKVHRVLVTFGIRMEERKGNEHCIFNGEGWKRNSHNSLQ